MQKEDLIYLYIGCVVTVFFATTNNNTNAQPELSRGRRKQTWPPPLPHHCHDIEGANMVIGVVLRVR